MKRSALIQLEEWKNRKNRKPLIIKGARQVGKTWLMLEFARTAFTKFVYVNFEEDEVLNHVFENDFETERIINAISLRKNVDIDADTLIIFDEIQAARRGVMSLKYFCEKAPQYYIIAAGSLLGISIHKGDSFPVGKVEFLNLYPMNFREFLLATGKDKFVEIIEKQDWQLVAMVKDKLIRCLKEYYIVGGMPEAVKSFAETGDFEEVRRIQANILLTYESDFSKHAPANEVPRIVMVWNSITAQLAKENRKFIYGMLRHGARAKEFELALEWLKDSGLISIVKRTKRGELPLNAFEDFSSFKVFLLDIGLMTAINKLPAETVLNGNEIFSTFRGALTEQYVCQQLVGAVDMLYYWSADNSQGEIDFLVQNGGVVIPVEVKAEENLKAKSLAAFVAKNPSLHGLRLTMSDYREQDWMANVPLYGVFSIFPEKH